ncbi:MAG: acetyl-CoA carboxylase biotin carboxylase subunit [Rhodospirillaceae bacterium]|nr:acetyl-CoA carboxylase biotin carboxylase subunit [Rhodospirillaceae bacterium]MBT4116549.1 acetyl-CoA carboxylase biotin carboxylase subunit [Rhodospirillaceae bacterium]MBT4671565.1 acetyl-CoA carboxylase biotin carboxylase subunit [Rhodospirillaceae bacterium]MBT4749941.1 acetyl-CoA carboxylase biotin carboxylase subunit [Rhodospirillaceae bacterium]MBT5178987.1 acetyl-CoA carboxylase biotin carboxylase subunit [Rhodospirillaceae bacterium]
MTISRVLIANRGEIAVRVIRAADALGIETVLAVSEPDRDSMAAAMAGRVICIGPASASASYLNVGAVVMAALAAGADAIHPGYGFLAESPDLADACAENGIKLVGPSADHMRQMGHKIEARALAAKAGVPTLAGSERVGSADEAQMIATRIGLPVMLKAASGGGGRGMKIVTEVSQLAEVFTAASAEARAAFGDDTLYLERYIANARHIEVQVLGDAHGSVIHLGERDCSTQRRHQKVIEEAPAPNISDEFRDNIRTAAVSLASNIGYEGAGTVEFIADQDKGEFYFLEMNCRVQVEHPVTEMITGIDIVQEQFRIAGGAPLSYAQSDVTINGHAIECRINAEIAAEDFRPSPGTITAWQPPEGPGIRLDSHCYEGYTVPMFYDSLLAKLIVTGPDRAQALAAMNEALSHFRIEGVGTTLAFLRHAIGDADFASGKVNTTLVDRLIREMPDEGPPTI